MLRKLYAVNLIQDKVSFFFYRYQPAPGRPQSAAREARSAINNPRPRVAPPNAPSNKGKPQDNKRGNNQQKDSVSYSLFRLKQPFVLFIYRKKNINRLLPKKILSKV